MAKTPTEPVQPEAEAEAVPNSPPRPWRRKLKIGGVVLLIVLAEWLVAYVYFPGSAQTSQAADNVPEEEQAEEPVASSEHATGHKEKDVHGGAPQGPTLSEFQEVDLGQFAVTGYQPVSSSTQFISFHLYGTVEHKHGEEFARRLEENKHRIRDNIIVIIRSAQMTDLTDAGLGLIKRRILETTNKTLGKPLMQTVVFSEFSFVEQ